MKHLTSKLAPLSIREWTCESCGENHDRDVNAAKNILKQGINILSGCGMQSDTKQKQDETLPLGGSATSAPKAWVGSSHSVSNRTHTNLNLKIEPVYDGISTAVSTYKVTDDNGSIWFQGTYDECYNALYGC